MLYTGMGWVSGQVVSWCLSTNTMSMKSLVVPLSRRAWTHCVRCVSVVSSSTSREREVADGVEAMVYLHGRWHSQFVMCTQGEGGALAGVGGERGSTAVEVSTGLHVGESREGVVLEDFTDKHAKQLELGSGGVWSIHCGAKNPPAHPPLPPLMSYPSPQGRVCLQHPWLPGAP